MTCGVKVYPDGRIRCKTKAAWEKQRKAVFEREKGLCEKCMAYAPLHNTEEAFAGHAHHIHGRKHGDDRPEVLLWLCGRCHAKLHIPEKVVPAKPKVEYLIKPRIDFGKPLDELISQE